MRAAPIRKHPAVHSFVVLRCAVGWIALSLPFALALPWWLATHGSMATSISSYYYTGMRDIFVGSICAIGVINMCCRGYDRHDTVVGILSGIFALGVAFVPTTPEHNFAPFQRTLGNIHILFATLLFLTLAYFCFVLFTMTAHGHIVTRRKRHRNHVYRICGSVILASVALMFFFRLIHRVDLVGSLPAMLTFETTALFAFGIAWMVKGGALLQDEIAREKSAEALLQQKTRLRRERKKRQMAGA